MVDQLLTTRSSLRGGVNGKLQRSPRNFFGPYKDITATHTSMQKNKTPLMYFWGIFNLSQENLTYGSLIPTNIIMLVGMYNQMMKMKEGRKMKNAREKKVDKTNNLRNGRMVVFDWSKCSASLISNKLKLGLIATAGGVKKADNMSSDILKVCNYFTKKKLFGFLSANPGSYNIQDVAEFYNKAKFEDGCIKSSVKGTAISFNLKEFADIFELPHDGDANMDIDNKLLIPCFRRKRLKERKQFSKLRCRGTTSTMLTIS